MAEKRFGNVFSRVQQKIANNLGVIDGSNRQGVRKYRRDFLETLDSYYEARQYDGLMSWDQAAESSEYVPIRRRKPRINYNLVARVVDEVASKLVGEGTYPRFTVEDDPDTTEFLRMVQKLARMQPKMLRVVRRMLLSGSAFARFKVVEGVVQIETYNSKVCYPEFDELGELASVRVQYVFDDPIERDSAGKPVRKWYRLDLGTVTDTLYDNPVFNSEAEPVFEVAEQVTHGLGYVQGEWFRTDDEMHTPDGPSIVEDILELADEINYSLSQSNQAVAYNQEPLLGVSGIDADEIEKIIRSSTKALNLGRDGKAAFIETNMAGVEAANTQRDRLKQKALDVVRCVILDPEKIVGSAQSAKAMEVLHGPLVALVQELRPQVQKGMQNLILKMAVTLLQLNAAGAEIAITIPDGYQPESLELSTTWPEIFPLTIEDLQKKIAVAVSASNASIVSRETAMRWVAKDFGIENIEEELAKIAAQPVINPFGAF